MVAALFVPWFMIHFGDAQGWKMAFILTGALGISLADFLVLALQPAAKQPHCPRPNTITSTLTMNRRRCAQNGDKAKKVPWFKLFGYRQLWAFFAGKFMTDGIWWFYPAARGR